MAAKQAAPPPDAPGTETVDLPPVDPKTGKRPRKHMAFYPDGKDYVLVAVQADEAGEPIPNGALAPVPDTPRFTSALEGERWVTASGAKLAGMLVICVKMCWRMRVLVQNKPIITVTKDERFRQALEKQAPAPAAMPESAAAG